MNKTELQKAYAALEALEQFDVDVPEDVEKKVSETELRYIEKVVLPALKDCATKVMEPLREAFNIKVHYSPILGVHCTLSTQLEFDSEESAEDEFAEFVDDDTDLLDSDSILLDANEKRKITRGKKTILRVTFPDGTIICEKNAKDTLLKSILKIGIERSASVPDVVCDNLPLITNRKDKRLELSSLAKGWWICTHSSTLSKKKQLDKICDALHLNLKVEVI